MSQNIDQSYIDIIQSYIINEINEKLLIPIVYKKDSTIINEGDSLNDFIFVLNGKIKISQNYENGKTLLLQFIDGFTLLGDIEYFLKENAYCTVQAITDVKALILTYSDVDKHYKNNVLFLKNIMIQMGKKILQTNNYASINLIYALETRLASYLLGLSINHHVRIPNLSDVANHLGTSYRHLIRVIKKFKEQKIISKHHQNIDILDQKKLMEIGRGNIYERHNDIVVDG